MYEYVFMSVTPQSLHKFLKIYGTMSVEDKHKEWMKNGFGFDYYILRFIFFNVFFFNVVCSSNFLSHTFVLVFAVIVILLLLCWVHFLSSVYPHGKIILFFFFVLYTKLLSNVIKMAYIMRIKVYSAIGSFLFIMSYI